MIEREKKLRMREEKKKKKFGPLEHTFAPAFTFDFQTIVVLSLTFLQYSQKDSVLRLSEGVCL